MDDFDSYSYWELKDGVYVAITKEKMDEIDSILGLTTVEFRFQTDIFDNLKQLAESKGTPVQTLIRQILTEYSQNAE